MFRHILIPLDGSHLAEAALRPTAELSKKLGAAVTLIHVIEKNAAPEVHGDRHLTTQDEACEYLGRLTEQAFPADTDVENHVHSEEVRNVARSISDHIEEYGPDLIVMCTHGHGGLHEMMAGSIAQQVIGMVNSPILLLRPDEAGGVYVSFDRLMVALDGSPEHEASLDVAGELAGALGAALHLVNVVQTAETLHGDRAPAGRFLPSTTKAMLDMTEDYAREYLVEKAKIWKDKGLVVTAKVRRGDISKELAAEVTRADCHLIVLGTHGRAGANAFWSGSVAPKLALQLRVPMLLVPAKKSSS
jgi:nucleotide-binding universal stress UspA family protein